MIPAGSKGITEGLRGSEPSPGGDYGPLHGWAMVWTLLGIFVGGMALNLTPCIYPLIPITLSYFAGTSGRKGTMIHGASYVLGIAFTNSMLGVSAALTGGLMGSLLQNAMVLAAMALLMMSLSLSLFGFWDIKVPPSLMRAASTSHTGYLGSLFMGLMMGVVAAPCIGPFVLGMLTWVAGMGSPWLGFIIFFTLSLGMGLPFFFLAVFSGNISRLPRSGEWMLWVRKLMGWVLMVMAIYFVRPLLPEAPGIFTMAGVMAAAGIHLGWIDRTEAAFKAFDGIKLTIALAALTFAVVLSGNFIAKGAAARFNAYDETLLLQAKNEGRPVIIDFSAQWCSPCRELDDLTFRDNRIKTLAEKAFILIRVDLTRKGNPVHEKLLQDYHIKGVPTVVFLDRSGREIQTLRLVDFEPPDKFLERMKLAGSRE